MHWTKNYRPPPSRSSGTTSEQRNTECKVQSVPAAQAALASLAQPLPSRATTLGRTLLLGHCNSWFLRPACIRLSVAIQHFFKGQSAPAHFQSDHVYCQFDQYDMLVSMEIFSGCQILKWWGLHQVSDTATLVIVGLQ